MKIYGAGSLDDIKRCARLGAVGILTNPQGFEVYFEGKKTLTEITRSILDVTDLPVFIQIHGKSPEAIVRRAEELHALSPQVGFKIISDEKGFAAISRLAKQNVKCIATTLFTLSQAALAASTGAFGICPFVSRGQAIGMDMFRILSTIRKAYDRLERAPQIIAVSMKSVADVELALAAGVDAVGMRYPLIRQMMEHPLTTKAELLFGKNWMKVKGEDVSYLRGAGDAEGIAEDSVH
jgi:transaldolase